MGTQLPVISGKKAVRAFEKAGWKFGKKRAGENRRQQGQGGEASRGGPGDPVPVHQRRSGAAQPKTRITDDRRLPAGRSAWLFHPAETRRRGRVQTAASSLPHSRRKSKRGFPEEAPLFLFQTIRPAQTEATSSSLLTTRLRFSRR